MEAAAKKVQLLAQRILPDRPHHLSVSPDQRFRVPPDHSKIFEEFKHQRLQYMTLLSDADRGMLLTRPYYDMREEPPNPTMVKEPNTKMEKKSVTKLSLSDYKNKQKKTVESPPDSGATPKTDASRREAPDARSDREPKRAEAYRGRDSEAFRDPKAHKSRDAAHDDRSSRPEGRSRPSQENSDTPEKRKRALDADGELRPQKRARPEASTPLDDRSRTPRDDTPKRKELHASQDRTPQKDGKSAAGSLTNGRSALKAALGPNPNRSPVSRARGDSINGNRPSPSSSNRSKADTASSRTTMPPLLSPLHLPNESDAHAREKKRREDIGEHNKPQKSLKPEPPPPLKRPQSPLRLLPSLLSPTLPPVLEEELARMKTTPTKDSTPNPKTQPPESPTSIKRPYTISKAEDEERKDLKDTKDKARDRPRRFMVTLKYSRKISKSVQRLLALPPKKDIVKKERSVSTEPPAPSQSRKRPPGTTENVGDSIAVKRPKTSDIMGSSKLVTPSTPSKAATSMSRVASSNSVNTPGDGSGHTPAAPPSADRDRPQTKGERKPLNQAKIQLMRERHFRFMDLGKRLKHERDTLVDRKNNDRVSESDIKLGTMLGLESALAFMVSFRALFEARSMENKAQDPKQWISILPILHMMRSDLRINVSLEALSWQLQAIIHEELIKCFWSIDPIPHAVAIVNHERSRSHAWKMVAENVDRVEDGAMRVNMGPWTTAEEAVAMALKIMRRWAHDERVPWRAEVTVSAANGTS
ncbi:hypothetical protein CSOJ01_01101 [Colletotrichum sojae]|uniref:Uncharacterized protein n=1 Tax=Colletotrichum sojae TaxID=2175907 RepID=A0A8H6JW09_9PEZI|nr:hypothetical protein CSOJ01_01101 [Colletotrichum sojae]